MNYSQLITTISQIIENEDIYKEGLTLVYELEPQNHKKMDEHLFHMGNNPTGEFEHKDVIEVEISGVVIRFITKE